MKREQRRDLKRQARHERSRREHNAQVDAEAARRAAAEERRRQAAAAPIVVADYQRAETGIAAMLTDYMRMVGMPLPILTLDRHEVIKDAEIMPAERIEHRT